MADDIIEQEPPGHTDAQDSGDWPDDTPEQAIVSGILPWIVTVVIAILCAAAGLAVGHLFAGFRELKKVAPAQSSLLFDSELLGDEHPAATDSGKTWYYDLDPVTANLNEPNFARYVRIAVTLEMDKKVDASKGRALLDQKKTLLANILAVYLASLSTDSLKGHENLEQLRSQILGLFNSELFPDSKPRIRQILLKQLAISISPGG